MFSLVFIALVFNSVGGEIYYTDPNSHVTEPRDGSWSRPFKKIADCVAALSGKGDQCQIRAGTYHEEIELSDLTGTEEDPIVIQGYGDERPTLDGTVLLSPVSGKWEQDGDVYYGEIDHMIWQLFFDDLMMTNARWPNANWSEKTVFDGQNHWAKTSTESSRGKIIDRGTSLEESGLNMTGGMAVLNIGAWNTFVAQVDWHEPGQNSFTYDDTFGKIKFNVRKGRFFVESKRELLDAPEEWFYDKETRVLYFIPPAGREFDSTTQLRGKVQTFAMTMTNCQNVILKNINFFGTTLRGVYKKRSYLDNIRFDSLNFLYPCSSKRMLQEKTVSECTSINGRWGKQKPTDDWGSFKFFNNTFHGSDGPALQYFGSKVVVENNLFEYNDWTSANTLVGGGGHGTLETTSIHDVYIRNTFRYNGESHGLRPGWKSNATLNRVIGQCWGQQANDGAGIQVTSSKQNGTLIERNWVHNSPKSGIRFDGEPPRTGDHGTISHNVLTKLGSGSAQVKGDYHLVHNNLVFETPAGETREFPGCSLCVWRHVRGNSGQINKHSTVLDNIADVANGGVVFDFNRGRPVKPIRVWPLQGVHDDSNLVDPDIKSLLHDPDNFDFRPFYEDITVGPYPYNPHLTTYWIPGRQLYKASSPVPTHGAQNVQAARRDTLMWLNAHGCNEHRVYLGTSRSEARQADMDTDEYMGTTTDGGNVMYLEKELEVGVKYFWRVDALCGDRVVKGDVWKFITV